MAAWLREEDCEPEELGETDALGDRDALMEGVADNDADCKALGSWLGVPLCEEVETCDTELDCV